MHHLLLSHLEPYSYVDRGFQAVCILLWTLQHIGLSRKGFPAINIFNQHNRNIRSAVAWLIVLGLLLQAAYDGINMEIKYREGYVVVEKGDQGRVFVKPAPYDIWSTVHVDLLACSNAIYSFYFIVKCSAQFLGLAFWCTIAKKKLGEAFGSTYEFRFYKGYAVFSILLYITATYGLAKTITQVVVYPQLVYHVQCVLIIMLTALVNYRLTQMLSNSSLSSDVRRRVRYYISVSNAQLIFVAFELVGLGTINLDILVGESTVASSPWMTDVFTHMYNVGSAGSWVALVFSIMPRFEDDEISMSRSVALVVNVPKPKSTGPLVKGTSCRGIGKEQETLGVPPGKRGSVFVLSKSARIMPAANS